MKIEIRGFTDIEPVITNHQLKITAGESEYTIYEMGRGVLVIQSTHGSLAIFPRAANSAHIRSVPAGHSVGID